MNRKNLTAAVLAGLAGAAGIAGTAQAVNINPDGLGQVLIYPYYTANEGNQTILSVVNTTEQAKAVKVRFLEGFNSREVLDFNLYLSEADVWVASLSYQPNSEFPAAWQAMYPEGGTVLQTTDTSCTVPYLYQMGVDAGKMGAFQPFLDIAYVDNGCFDYDGDGDDDACFDFNDAGPDTIMRAAEGHFEIIEMGTIFNDSENGVGEAITHDPDTGMPDDCPLLTELWTDSTDEDEVGQWILDVEDTDGEKGVFVPGVGTTDIARNSGGLFGGAAVINAMAGSMFSYDAIAIQGFDKFEDGLGLHFEPGTIYPSLNSGDQNHAWLFFGPPTNEPWVGYYEGYDDNYGEYFDTSVDAISALFMKSNIVNEYYTGDALLGATEWVMTFPTKNFYVDAARVLDELLVYLPLTSGGELDTILVDTDDDQVGDTEAFEYEPAGWNCDGVWELDDDPATDDPRGYLPGTCSVIVPRDPFTRYFGETQTITDDVQGDYIAADCEVVTLKVWDREEMTPEDNPTTPDGNYPPVVSPSLPVCDPAFDPTCPIDVEEVPFQLCNEVNVIRFGDRVIFDTPDFAPEDFDSRDDASVAADWENLNHSLLITADVPYSEGWARVTIDNGAREDENGLVGLPVTGFAAQRYSNQYLTDDEGNKVRSTYGGLFRHKGLVTRNAANTDVGFMGRFPYLIPR